MKAAILLFVSSILSFHAHAQSLPNWATDLAYSQNGSCEIGKMSFNASRFSKINLNKKRAGLDVYLQVILFLKDNNQASYRKLELGLIGCNETEQGPVCGYKNFNDTLEFVETTWSETEDSLKVDGLGAIKKIREDYPWLGYELSISEEFDREEARGSQTIGGKVGINFNDVGWSASKICRQKP